MMWQVHLFIDSTVALGTLLRGASRQADWNALVGDLWLSVATAGWELYAWRVPSRQNPADAPTRPVAKSCELQSLQALGFSETEWAWPPLPSW